jgi:hypothetical protein
MSRERITVNKIFYLLFYSGNKLSLSKNALRVQLYPLWRRLSILSLLFYRTLYLSSVN